MATFPYSTTQTFQLRTAVGRIDERPTFPTLESVLSQQHIFPAYSLILGMCADQLPLVLDLTEPGPGSFLISADSGISNTTLLHSILTSAFLLNTESEVNLHLISPQADNLTQFHSQPNFKISYQPERPECEIVLEEMANLIESRQQKNQPLPYHVLFIDSLDLLWGALSPQGKSLLTWIVTHGPKLGFTVFASQETDYLNPDLYSLINNFSSRILGKIKQPGQARYLSGHNPANLGELIPELEYLTISGEQSFNIYLLPTENER